MDVKSIIENEIEQTHFRFLNSLSMSLDKCLALTVLITQMLSGGISGSEMVKYDKC